MLVESLVISHLNYALPVRGPSLNNDLFSCLCRLHNQAVRATCELRKCDHVSDCRLWASVATFGCVDSALCGIIQMSTVFY